MIRLPSLLCALLILLSGPTETAIYASVATSNVALLNSWKKFAFKIEDAKCRVGIASVKLSVSELTHRDGNLVATYAIQVPLSKSSNDTGLIVLPIDVTVDELSKKGGVLRGTAYSNKQGAKPNAIVCEVRPLTDKGIRLEITTDKRTLNFESSYTVINTGAGS
jgi:hypothetical protein